MKIKKRLNELYSSLNEKYKCEKKDKDSLEYVSKIKKGSHEELIGLNSSIPSSCFRRVIKDLLNSSDTVEKYRITKEAMSILQEAAEFELANVFFVSKFLASKEDRGTVRAVDLKTAQLINKIGNTGLHVHSDVGDCFAFIEPFKNEFKKKELKI